MATSASAWGGHGFVVPQRRSILSTSGVNVMLVCRLLIAAIVTLMVASAVNAKESIRVRLKVVCEEPYRDEFVSNLNRQLRDFDDIEIVEVNPQVMISLVALPITHEGKVIGHACSCLVEVPAGYASVREALAKQGGEDVLKKLDETLKNATFRFAHFVMTCGVDEVRTTCKKAVAKIDVEAFEVFRIASQKSRER